jgi:hypothetical protein
MQLTPEQLIEIERLAGLFFSFEEIALLINADLKLLIQQFNNVHSPAAIAYRRGVLISEKEIREQIISMAKLGNPAAQTEAMKLMQKQNIKNSAYGTRRSN